MNNKSVSDFVAAAMNAALQSEEHKSLFNTQYKFASAEDENDAKDKCSKCDKKHDECKCGDSMMADDNDAKKKKDSEDSKDSKDSSAADDDKDSSAADDDEELSSAAFDVAIDSLLTASAALDSVGLARGSALSLKLASLVVEAKKKDSSKDKEKAAKEKAKEKAAKEKEKEKAAKEKEKAKRDSQAAKDKASKEKAKEKEKASKEKEKASKEKDSKDSKKSGNSSKK